MVMTFQNVVGWGSELYLMVSQKVENHTKRHAELDLESNKTTTYETIKQVQGGKLGLFTSSSYLTQFCQRRDSQNFKYRRCDNELDDC
jgi:Rad3-related DNA helicase